MGQSDRNVIPQIFTGVFLHHGIARCQSVDIQWKYHILNKHNFETYAFIAIYSETCL